MNLQSTIEIYAGGSGSGCKGPNCGRPKILYHVTDEKNLSSILKSGLKLGRGGDTTEFPADYDKRAVYAVPDNDLSARRVIANKLFFGEMERDRMGHQVIIAFRPKGDVMGDEETMDDNGKAWGLKHIGAVPASNIIGYHKMSNVSKGGEYADVVRGKISRLIKK